MAPTLGGGTQDTDFNKGFTKGKIIKNLRQNPGHRVAARIFHHPTIWGCQGHQAEKT